MIHAGAIELYSAAFGLRPRGRTASRNRGQERDSRRGAEQEQGGVVRPVPGGSGAMHELVGKAPEVVRAGGRTVGEVVDRGLDVGPGAFRQPVRSVRR
ncbi:hypothetical protein CGZ69_33570 [Streptomyces peucetius subsp. caesius ATCC 27952]|nr:hypothetical protein CGZ69_33570 [Streptomyces peucetius subsp. caesius ATCC 27952]